MASPLGPKPYRPDAIWSFSLTRHVGAPLVDSHASLVPGLDVLCVFGFMGCLLIDAVVFPFALIHDICLLASGGGGRETWRRPEEPYEDAWLPYRSPYGP